MSHLAHVAAAWGLAAVLCLHAGAAVWHQVVLRNGLLGRILHG